MNEPMQFQMKNIMGKKSKRNNVGRNKTNEHYNEKYNEITHEKKSNNILINNMINASLIKKYCGK